MEKQVEIAIKVYQFHENRRINRPGFICRQTGFIRQADEASPPADQASPPANEARLLVLLLFSYFSFL